MTFVTLFRTFFAQFFASESVTSDHQIRQAVIAVVRCLIMPGMLMSCQMFPSYQFAAIRLPALLEPLTSLFITLVVLSPRPWGGAPETDGPFSSPTISSMIPPS